MEQLEQDSQLFRLITLLSAVLHFPESTMSKDSQKPFALLETDMDSLGTRLHSIVTQCWKDDSLEAYAKQLNSESFIVFIEFAMKLAPSMEEGVDWREAIARFYQFLTTEEYQKINAAALKNLTDQCAKQLLPKTAGLLYSNWVIGTNLATLQTEIANLQEANRKLVTAGQDKARNEDELGSSVGKIDIDIYYENGAEDDIQSQIPSSFLKSFNLKSYPMRKGPIAKRSGQVAIITLFAPTDRWLEAFNNLQKNFQEKYTKLFLIIMKPLQNPENLKIIPGKNGFEEVYQVCCQGSMKLLDIPHNRKIISDCFGDVAKCLKKNK